MKKMIFRSWKEVEQFIEVDETLPDPEFFNSDLYEKLIPNAPPSNSLLSFPADSTYRKEQYERKFLGYRDGTKDGFGMPITKKIWYWVKLT